jgi:CDP-diacylglycerol--glycerol-3-phosphate 3-phosphatidyltransferase
MATQPLIPYSGPIPPWKKKLPMWLTWSRMAVCPFIVGFMMMEGEVYRWLSAALFIAASITDWFDGYLARKYDAISNMGKFMDPIADKILVASTLIMLIPSGHVGPVVVLLLLSRDILIGGIRAVAAADRVIIDAKAAGKWKTGMQMVAIPAILIDITLAGISTVQLGSVLLWVSVVLSLFSGYQYIQFYNSGRKVPAA